MTHSHEFLCHEVLRRLDDYLDRELGPEELEAVERHLEVCAQCAREAHFEASILDDFRSKLRRVQLPTGLVQRIHTALDRDQDLRN